MPCSCWIFPPNLLSENRSAALRCFAKFYRLALVVFNPKQEEVKVSCGEPLLESADHTTLVSINSFRQSRSGEKLLKC